MHFRKRELKLTGLVCTLLLFFSLIFLCNGAMRLVSPSKSEVSSSHREQSESPMSGENTIPQSKEQASHGNESELYSDILSGSYTVSAVIPSCPVFLPAGYGAVSEETRSVAADLCSSDGLASLTDKTLYAISADIDALLTEYPVSKSKAPTVVIYHTHTSEGYEISETDRYPLGISTEAQSDEFTVTAVGKALAGRLEKKGIRVIHITDTFDYPSRSGSFKRSASAVEKALKNEKNISLVIDLHRGTLLRTGGDKLKPTVQVNGKKAAQISLIACCDKRNELGCADWEEKLSLSLALNRELNRISPLICLPVSLESQKYNLDLPYPCVMAEIGTDMNTADEAKLSAAILADAVEALILDTQS